MYKDFRHQELMKPLFIRTDNYSEVLTDIDTIKNYVNRSNDFIFNLKNLKKNTDVEHNYLKEIMEDIQRKLIYVDKVLFNK